MIDSMAGTAVFSMPEPYDARSPIPDHPDVGALQFARTLPLAEDGIVFYNGHDASVQPRHHGPWLQGQALRLQSPDVLRPRTLRPGNDWPMAGEGAR